MSENASLEPRWREWLRCVPRDAVPCLNSSASWLDVSAEPATLAVEINVAVLILLGVAKKRERLEYASKSLVRCEMVRTLLELSGKPDHRGRQNLRNGCCELTLHRRAVRQINHHVKAISYVNFRRA